MDSKLQDFTDSLDPTRKAQWDKVRRYEKSITFWFGIAVLGWLLMTGAWAGMLIFSEPIMWVFATATVPAGLVVGFANSRAKRHQREKRNFIEEIATWPIPRQQENAPSQTSQSK
jgi:hypothetical protein